MNISFRHGLVRECGRIFIRLVERFEKAFVIRDAHRHRRHTVFFFLSQAPLSFFSSTPAGRILNRFSSDLYTVDSSLPFILNIFLAQIFGVIGVIVVVCASLPLFLLFLIPLGIFYHRVQFYYRHTSREVRLSTERRYVGECLCISEV